MRHGLQRCRLQQVLVPPPMVAARPPRWLHLAPPPGVRTQPGSTRRPWLCITQVVLPARGLELMLRPPRRRSRLHLAHAHLTVLQAGHLLPGCRCIPQCSNSNSSCSCMWRTLHRSNGLLTPVGLWTRVQTCTRMAWGLLRLVLARQRSRRSSSTTLPAWGNSWRRCTTQHSTTRSECQASAGRRSRCQRLPAWWTKPRSRTASAPTRHSGLAHHSGTKPVAHRRGAQVAPTLATAHVAQAASAAERSKGGDTVGIVRNGEIVAAAAAAALLVGTVMGRPPANARRASRPSCATPGFRPGARAHVAMRVTTPMATPSSGSSLSHATRATAPSCAPIGWRPVSAVTQTSACSHTASASCGSPPIDSTESLR